MKITELKERKFKTYVCDMLEFDYYKASNTLISDLHNHMKGKLRKLSKVLPEDYSLSFNKTEAGNAAIFVRNSKDDLELIISLSKSGWGNKFMLWNSDNKNILTDDTGYNRLPFENILKWISNHYSIGNCVLNEI